MGKELFTFPDKDVAIFYLPDEFYKPGGRWVKNPDNHLKLASELALIGEDVGVLGYPMQSVGFEPDGRIKTDSVIIRTDKGVVNTYYMVPGNGTHLYEFTMTFNPGNSGGPIIRQDNGEVIGIVHGFASFSIEIAQGTTIWNSYSQGYAMENMKAFKDEHGLAYG